MQRPRAKLGPPLASGWVFVPDDPNGAVEDLNHGRVVEVAVWAAPEQVWARNTWRGWVYIQGHPDYDPPRRVLGDTQFYPTLLAFEILSRWMGETGAYPVIPSAVRP